MIKILDSSDPLLESEHFRDFFELIHIDQAPKNGPGAFYIYKFLDESEPVFFIAVKHKHFFRQDFYNFDATNELISKIKERIKNDALGTYGS